MKKLNFGEDVRDITGNKIEALVSDDVLSARTLNRPFLEFIEDEEINYKILQSSLKTLYGHKENVYIDNCLESASPDNLQIGCFWDDHRKVSIRLPLGAFLLRDKNCKYGEDDSYLVVNRPNLSLFERQIAKAFCLNLNDYDNDIKVTYNLEDGYKLNYKYLVYDHYETGTLPKEGKAESVFDLVKAFNSKFGSYLTEKIGFGLEEFIPVYDFLVENDVYTEEESTSKTIDCYIYYLLREKQDGEHVSNTGRFGIKVLPEDGFTETPDGEVPLYTFQIKVSGLGNGDTVENSSFNGGVSFKILDKNFAYYTVEDRQINFLKPLTEKDITLKNLTIAPDFDNENTSYVELVLDHLHSLSCNLNIKTDDGSEISVNEEEGEISVFGTKKISVYSNTEAEALEPSKFSCIDLDNSGNYSLCTSEKIISDSPIICDIATSETFIGIPGKAYIQNCKSDTECCVEICGVNSVNTDALKITNNAVGENTCSTAEFNSNGITSYVATCCVNTVSPAVNVCAEKYYSNIDSSGLVFGKTISDTQANIITANSNGTNSDVTIYGSLTVNEKNTSNGAVTINGNSTVAGTTTVTGSLYNCGNLQANGNLTLTSTTATHCFGATTVCGTYCGSGTATINGNSTVTGTTTVTGSFSNSGNLQTNGNLTLTSTGTHNFGTTTVGGTYCGCSSVGICGNATVAGTTTVTGSLSSNGNLYASGDLALTSAGTHYFGTTAVGGTYSTWNGNGYNTVGISSNATVAGTTTVTGSLSSSGNLQVNGSLTLTNAVTHNFGSTTVGGTYTGDSTVNISCDATINGTTCVYSDFYNCGGLTIVGVLSLTNSNATHTVGTTTVCNYFRSCGDFTVSGSATVGGSTTVSSGCSLYICGNLAVGSSTSGGANLSYNGTSLVIDKPVSATSFTATSARSKKKDIVPTVHTNAVEEINKIDIVDFTFKDDETNTRRIGFIADDTDEVFSKDRQHFDINNTVGMLLKAVQELSKENKELKKRLDNLK